MLEQSEGPRKAKGALDNLAFPELVIVAVAIGLFVLWLMGVIKLFQKNQTVLGWIAVAGIIVPPIGLVGFSGWFVGPRTE